MTNEAVIIALICAASVLKVQAGTMDMADLLSTVAGFNHGVSTQSRIPSPRVNPWLQTPANQQAFMRSMMPFSGMKGGIQQRTDLASIPLAVLLQSLTQQGTTVPRFRGGFPMGRDVSSMGRYAAMAPMFRNARRSQVSNTDGLTNPMDAYLMMKMI